MDKLYLLGLELLPFPKIQKHNFICKRLYYNRIKTGSLTTQPTTHLQRICRKWDLILKACCWIELRKKMPIYNLKKRRSFSEPRGGSHRNCSVVPTSCSSKRKKADSNNHKEDQKMKSCHNKGFRVNSMFSWARKLVNMLI